MAQLPELPEDIRGIDLTDIKKNQLAQASEFKRQLLEARKPKGVQPDSFLSQHEQRVAGMQAENAEYMAKRAQKQEAFDNSWVGRSGVDPDSFTAGVIDGGAMLTAGAGYLAGTLLTTAPNTIAALQELGTSDEVKEAYTRFKQGQASEADIALLNQKQDLFTTNQEGLERADHLREGTRGIMDLFDWKGAIDAPQREPLREEFAEEAGPAVDRLAQAWEQVKEGEYAEAAKGTGWALPKVAYEIAENAIQHPVGAVTYGLENAPQLAAGVAGKLPMAVSNAGYAFDELRQGMDNYEKDNKGARPSGSEFREMLLRASSLAAAEHIADTQVLKTLTSPVTKTSGKAADAVGGLASKVLPEKAAGVLAKLAKATGTVLGTGATETVTEGFQTYQEGEIKNRKASPMDIAEGALLGFAAGGATAAASKAPADLLGSTGEKKEPEVEKASETGNVSSLLQPGAYAPEKAAKALVKHSLKNEDAQVRQGNLAKLGEIRSALEDEAKAEAMVERIQQHMESAPQEQQPQLEAMLAQATESLTAIRAALGLQDVPAAERKEALAKQLDQVKQAEASITQLMEPEKQDLSSQIELADTVLENVTPEVQQTARKAAERVVSLAMESPESLDAEVATRLASNMANSLTEPERVVLRTFAKAKALAHQVKGLEGVSSDIFNGNPKEGYKGLNEYSSNVRRALSHKTPDLEAAQHEIDGLAKFVESRKAKLAVAQKAFDEVAGSAATQQWVRDKAGNWIPADRQYSYDEMYAMGGMTIHGGSGNLVANIAQETEALEAGLQSLQALYDMKSAAPVQTSVNQPEAATTQGVEPVAEQAPVQTPEQEASIAEDAPEAVKYRKTNNLKRLFTQQPGNAKTGTQRPLVATENFLTKLSQGEVSTLDYVQQEELSEEQLGLPSAFIRMAKAWMPTIEGNFFKRITQAGHKTDARDHYYNDYTQYLQDEQGQVAENVKTAIAAAAFAHVADNGGQTLNDNTTINKILGKDKDASITPTANQKLRRIGTLRSAMINSLGQAVVQSLGYQLKGDAPQSEKAKLEVALGAQVLALLLDQGIVEQTTLTKGELDDLKGVDFNGQIKTMRAVAKTKEDMEAIDKLIKARKHEVAFIRFVTNKNGALTQEAQAIRDASKNTGGLLTKLFGIETGPREPSFKPLKYDQKTANNSTKPISDKERAALEKEAKAPYILQKDMWAVLEKITNPAMILQMAGVQDVEMETLHKTNRDGVTAKNQGLMREWERLVAFVGELNRQKNGQDTKFYLMPSAWKNDRVGLDSAINPQTSKIHRFVVGKQSAETVVRWSDDDQTNLDVFKLRVAEGLGVKTDKQDNKRSLAAYEAEMQKPVYQDAVAALRKALLDQDLTSGEQQAIVEGVKAGGENFHSLSSLVAQATYENAREAGQQKFTTMLLAEVDGVTNGPMLGHLLFGAFGSLKDAMARLNKGGFFEKGNAFEQYNLWRAAPGQSDLYESTAIDLNKAVQKKWQDKKLQPMYSALFYVTGKLDDKGSPTKAGRNLMKPPVTKSGYGEGLGKTVETMAEDFIQQVYDHIQEISAGKSKLELQPLLSSVRLLISKADEKAAAELDVDMPIEKAMEFTFTNQQFKALKSTYLSTLGSDITATIKKAFGPFTARRQAFNQAANLAFDLYQHLYQSKRRALIEQLIAEGKMATDAKGVPLHDLTNKQEAELQASLTDVAPILHTAFSSASDQLQAGMRLAKRDKGLSDEAAYRNEVKFGKKGKKPMTGLRAFGYKTGEVGPGVSGAVGSVHSTDAAISINAGAEVDSINVHDARIYGLKDVHAGARSLNKQTFLQALEYSPMDQMLATLERSIKGLADALAQENDAALNADLASLLTEKIASLSDFEYALMADSGKGPIEYQLDQLRATALAAESMKLEILANLQAVDQYAFEGGAYKVTEQDRAKAQQKLEERKQRPDDVAATEAAKQIDALLGQKTAQAELAPVVQSEPTLVDDADLGIPERQEDPVVTTSAWGELGKSPIEHDSELVQFFKSNPQPSLKDVLKVLRGRIEATSNGRTKEFNRELWKALAKHVNPAMKIVYVTPEMAIPEGVDEKQAQSARGLYIFSDSMDTLYIKSDAFRRSGVTPELLMHELVHSVVARTIDLAEQGKPLPDTADLVAELGVLLERSRQHVADKPELARRYSNALANVQEFVAWGMTNQGFQRDVLNQFTVQTKTSRNVLVKAMEALTNVLRDILFRGSDKSAQKIQVTGLKTLLANVSGLMATAEQARETVGTQRTLSMEDPVLDMDVADLFDGLRNTEQPLDVGFESHLRDLLDNVVRPLHGPFGAVRLEALDDQAIGARERFLKALATGKAPFAAKLSDVVKLSDQEAFLAESIEVALRTALESKDRSSSLVYRELKGLYNEIKASLPVSAFFDGDWTQASDEQKAEAQALREFFLEVPDGEGQSDYLSRFAALGLAYRPLWKLLDRSTQQDTRALRDLTWLERLQALVERAMAYLAGKWTHTYAGQQANDKLKTLVGELVDIEAKYREKAARPNNQWIEMAENALAGAQGKAKDMIDQVAKSDMVRNSKISGVRLMGRVASLAADDRLEAVIDAGNQLRDRLFKGRQGLMAGMFNEMKGPNEIMLALLNFAKRNEQERKHLINWTRDMALGSFANEGKHLTAKDKDAMALLLRADLASLLDYGYSLEELQHLLSPNGSLQQRIAELGKQLKTSTHAAMYLRRAEALGKYMATGKASIDNLMLNADNIARMLGTKDAHSVPDAELDRVRPLIDQLASLYALANANESDKERIANVLATELQRTDGGNGVTFVLKMHRAMQQEAKEKLFENSEALFTKGYTPEIHNPHTEVLAATEEEGAALVRQGFQRVAGNPLNQDADDLDKRAKHLYVLKGRGMQQRLTGALSYTGERAKGSRKHGGIVNTITGSLNTHNVQVTQRLARAKRVREEMAIQQGKPMGGVHMIPVLNAAGEIVNYRYEMSNKARDSLLERTNAFDTLLGTLHGNVFDKQASREQNAQVVKALFDQWNADKDNRRDAYIMVGPDSSDAEGAETWRLLPHHTQEVIRQVWKGNNMMVRNDQIDLIAGYRKYSLADMFDKQERTTKGWKNLLKHQEDERNMLEQLFVWFTEDFLRLDKKAALRVRQAEDFWQAVVQEVKDIVVVRSGVTLFWNVVSNMTVLLWQGVPIKDLMRNHWVAWRGAVNYRKDSEELFRLEAALSTGTSGDAKATQQRIRQLQDSLARNPAKELIDAGMLPTIVEDVALEEDPYSYRSKLKEKVDQYTSKLNPTVKQVAAFVYMAPGTSLHTAMSQATQYSDFVARYTLYQHLISDKKAPKSKQEALKRISDSFVNYDVPSHRHMQYLNDMGLLMFTKYYLRIQKVIMQMFREHPARAIMMVTLDSYLSGMQTIVDSSMWGRLGNPLEWGALQYPGTLDELATIKGMMNLFK